MRCDTCQRETQIVMRVVVAKDYNRAMARPLYNCPACFEAKERAKAGAQSRRETQMQAKGDG